MAEVLWKRVYPGRNPGRVLVSADRIAFNYVEDQGQPGSPEPLALVCLDLEGREKWRAQEIQLLLAMPDASFLGVSSANELRHLDPDGLPLSGVTEMGQPVECRELTSASRDDDQILLRNGGELLVTDLKLRLLRRLELPEKKMGQGPVFTGSDVVWVESGSLMAVDLEGRTRTLCRIPVELALEAMDRCEKETGTPALGWWTSPPSQERQGMGERPGRYHWRLGSIAAPAFSSCQPCNRSMSSCASISMVEHAGAPT